MRRIAVSRGTRKVLDDCNADELDAAAAIARKERDKVARRVATVHAMDQSGRARKIEKAVEYATDAEFFKLAAQKLRSREHGKLVIVGNADRTHRMKLAELGEKTLMELVTQATMHVQRGMDGART